MDRDLSGVALADAAPTNSADAIPAANQSTSVAAFKAAMAGLRKSVVADAAAEPVRAFGVPSALAPATEMASRTATGRWLLDALQDCQVTIREDDAYLDRMAPAGLRMMAAYDPASKSIALRSGVDPAITASLLVHEGRHALQDAGGALSFDQQPWRLSAGAFMGQIRGVEADAHALQAQYAYELRQTGHSAAWDFLRQNKPAVAGAFEQSVGENAANLDSGKAMKAAFDAFLHDPVETKTYTSMNLPQWIASLREAPRGDLVGRQAYDPDRLAAVVKQGPKDYVGAEHLRSSVHGLDARTDTEVTKAAQGLVTLWRADPDKRAELLQKDEFQQALQTFRLTPQEVDQIAGVLPPVAESSRPVPTVRQTDRGR